MILPRQISLFTEEQLTSSPADSHANPTQWQEKDLAKKMNATFGQRCLEQFEKFNRHGSWAKTFSGLLIGMEGWSSTRCKLSWKLKGTKYNRMYFQLHPSTLPIEETEFGLLLTPTTREEVQDLEKFKARMEKYPNGTTMPNLATQVFNQLLPTPTSVQRDHPERVDELKKTGAKTIYSRNNGEERPNSIIDYMNFHNMLPTPTAQIVKHGHSEKYWDNRIGKRQMDIAMWNAETNGKTSQLSPQFVLEMMGFPTDWTLLPFLSGETNQSKQEGTQ